MITKLALIVLIILQWGIVQAGIATKRINVEYMDLTAYYVAARMWSEGVRERLYDLRLQSETQDQSMQKRVLLPFVATPISIIPLLPTAKMPYPAAVWVFEVIQLVILLGMALEYLREEKKLEMWVLGVLLFMPLIHNWLIGQWAVTLALSFWGARKEFRRGREFRSGWWLAILAIKPQLLVGPVLMLAMRKKFKILAGLVVGLGLVWIISELMMNGSFTRNYWELTERVMTDSITYVQRKESEATAYGLISVIFNEMDIKQKLAVWITGVTAIVWWANKRKGSHFDDMDWIWITVLSIFCSLHTNTYDLGLLILPMTWGYTLIKDNGLKIKWVVGWVVMSWTMVMVTWLLPAVTIGAVIWAGLRYNKSHLGEVAYEVK